MSDEGCTVRPYTPFFVHEWREYGNGRAIPRTLLTKIWQHSVRTTFQIVVILTICRGCVLMRRKVG